MFLKEFAEDTPWIHLDIASTCWVDEGRPWLAKGPTGTPVRAFVSLVEDLAKNGFPANGKLKSTVAARN